MGHAAETIRTRRRETHGVTDPIWLDLRTEAEASLIEEPSLAGLIWPSILARSSLEVAVAFRVTTRLASADLPRDAIADAWAEAISAKPEMATAMRADLRAVRERDPASQRVIDPVLFFKGFHALQAHRVAHWLWTEDRRDFAYLLQSRSSATFGTDIHPAARIGKGVFLDHATGFVAGETAVIEDDVSILQGVTLGGTGAQRRARHPQIRRGCLLGAGAHIIGSVEVGTCARVAAGSVVLEDVPPRTTVAGVPARIVGRGDCQEPAQSMDQRLAEAAYAAFTYTI